MIKIIFLADIIGKIGRRAVVQYLPELKKEYKPDLTIANVENLAHGIGFTQKTLDEMLDAGVDLFTSGNHAWRKGGSDDILNQENSLVIRPANYEDSKSGVGVRQLEIGQNKLIVVNLLGKVFIDEEVDNPFTTLEGIIKKYKKSLILVDFHAEATSEKNAFGLYFDGKVAAVLGTHTHVPTCDQRILSGGTGYITDAGMIGHYDSVIGADKNQIFNNGIHRHSSPQNDTYKQFLHFTVTQQVYQILDFAIKILKKQKGEGFLTPLPANLFANKQKKSRAF